MFRFISALDKLQVPLYLLALVGGAAVGLAWQGAVRLEPLINPLLGLLLFATFLAVPLYSMARAVADLRFLGSLLAANFVLVPAIVWLITRPLTDAPVLPAVLLVLLCPCVDYVIVFTRLAGGAAEKLLVATPLLLLAQMLALPVLLPLLGGTSVRMHAGPFFDAFLWLIAVPLAAAWLVQASLSSSSLSDRRHPVRTLALSLNATMEAAMVPLMMAVLAVVAASQAQRVATAPGQLLAIVPVYAAFAGLLILAMAVATRRMRSVEQRPDRIALIFSPVTRNSLVVLPFAFAMEASGAQTAPGLLPAAVVTQTMVELLVMVALVRLCHALLPVAQKPRPHA